MDIQLGDILTMKKPHPCGEKRWLVLRTGADFRLRCLGCGHEVMGARSKFEKNVKLVERKQESGNRNQETGYRIQDTGSCKDNDP